MQIFQRELQHFTNNIEYYFKTSALKQCSNVLTARINGLRETESALDSLNPEKMYKQDDLGIDMDKLVQLHKEFLDSAIRRCMLHQKFKYMRRELGNLMNLVLEFRKICKKYLLTSGEDDLSDDEVMSDGGHYGVQNRRQVEKMGMGLLKVNNPQFM